MEQGLTSLRGGASRGRLPGVSPGVLEADLLRALDRRGPVARCGHVAVVGDGAP